MAERKRPHIIIINPDVPAKQRRDVWRWHQEERFFWMK